MRCPSAKSLRDMFSIAGEKANLVRRVAKAADSGSELLAVVERSCPATAAYARSLGGDPYKSRMWRVTIALHAINDLIGGYGVESMGPARAPNFAPPYEYVEMGDPYATTLVYRRKTDTLSVGSQGDVAEKHLSW